MEFFLQLLVGGLRLGSVYALVALGYSLIYRATGLLTFVQGEYFMLGAFVSYTFLVLLGFPFAVSIALSAVLLFLLGVLTEKAVIGPLTRRGSKVIHIVLATIGLSILLRNGAMLLWGTDVKPFPSPFGEAPFQAGLVSILPQDLWILSVTILLMIGLHFFMEYTRFGTAMRAAAQDKGAAATLGVNVSFTVAVTWGLAAAVAGVAGVLIAPVYGVSAGMGVLVGLKGFAAAVAGGYGSMAGAIVGGLFLGLLETLASGYVSSDLKDIIGFIVLLAVLLFMPRGFLSSPVLEEGDA